MKHPTLGILVAAALAAVSYGAQAAGSVEVTFVRPDTYTDIGVGQQDRRSALEALQRCFEQLGAALPEGQTLTIEVLDVDLAGEWRWTRQGHEQRILKGMADWPRMQLKYTLSAGGRTIRSGEDRLSDMSYLRHAGRVPDTRAYAHDLQMIEDWFAKTFVAAK